MKTKKLTLLFVATIGIIFAAGITYKKFIQKPKNLPYITQKPKPRTIAKIIDTSGKLSVAEKNKIGSLVTGILKKLYVDENETVKKDQLLAEIDTGKGDTEVRQAKGLWLKTQAKLTYQEQYFQRQEKLFKAGQVAKNEFDKIISSYEESKADVIIAKAQYDKAKEEFENTKIYAPQEGIVIDIGIAEGERVTTDLNATILFEIAKDICKMEASLEIDESDVGLLKKGLKVEFTVDSFPQKVFKTTIKEISYSPKKKNGNHYYKATTSVDNHEQLLRPGLSVNAKIFIAKVKNALTITSQAFMINSKVVKEIANDLNYSYHPVSKEDKKKETKQEERAIQTVWIVQKNGIPHSFVEKIIKTNLTDDIYFEVVSGLDKDDDVIVDIEETDYMEEIFKKAFKSKF